MGWPTMVVVYLEPNVDLWMQEALDVAAAVRSFAPLNGEGDGWPQHGRQPNTGGI